MKKDGGEREERDEGGERDGERRERMREWGGDKER